MRGRVFLFWQHTRREFPIRDDVVNPPHAVLFFPGFEIAILGLGYLAGGSVGQKHPVPASVIGEVAGHDNVDDDHLYADFETPEECGRPQPKSSHRLFAIKTGLALRAVGEFGIEDRQQAVDIGGVVGLAVFRFRDGNCVLVALENDRTSAVGLRST
jgi:hypothetical protein